MSKRTIQLKYDDKSGLSDTAAANMGKIESRNALRSSQSTYKFGNVVYLNEWRIAKNEQLLQSIDVVVIAGGRTTAINDSGRMEFWADELTVWDKQLNALLRRGKEK